MRTKEVAEICGVTEECIRQNAKKVGIVLENGKIHEYTEGELKRIQIQLMKNAQNNNVNASAQVKDTSKTVLEVGILAKTTIESGNIEAAQQFSKLLIQATAETARNKELEVRNKLLIEQKEALQKEVDKYVNWKAAKEIKLEFKLPARPGIEKVAMLLNLKENEDWIARFYDDTHPYKKILYNPEAVERIVEYIKS